MIKSVKQKSGDVLPLHKRKDLGELPYKPIWDVRTFRVSFSEEIFEPQIKSWQTFPKLLVTFYAKVPKLTE